MTSGVIDREARLRLLGMRWSLGLLGVAIAVALVVAFPDIIVPQLLPLLLLVAVPEIRTGAWLWRNDPDAERGRGLFFAYAGWGLLRWFGLGLLGVIAAIVVGGIVLQAVAPQVMGYPGNPVLNWLLIRVTVGSLFSVGVMLVLAVLVQLTAMGLAPASGVRLYVGVSVVYAWLRQEYPPPLAVDFVRQARPGRAMIAFGAALVGFAVWGCVMYLVAGFFWYLHRGPSGAVVLALVLTMLFMPYAIGTVAQKGLAEGYREPTPRECWRELYPPQTSEPGDFVPGELPENAQDSTAIRPSSHDLHENPP